ARNLLVSREPNLGISRDYRRVWEPNLRVSRDYHRVWEPTCALVATITGFGSPTWALVATIGVLERELGQDFLPLGKMLDRLRADLVEAPVQALAQDPGARRGGVEPRQEHEVRALLVEAQRLGDVVGREHHARVGRLHVHRVHQAQVARAPQHVIGDAGDDQLGVLDTRVPQRVRVSDVTVDALDVAAPQLAHHRRVEVDDQDLLDERARLLRRSL